MTVEQYIQKGFNHGYELQKHEPELAQTLQQGFVEKDSPYAQGFVAGCQEFVKEQEQTKGHSSLLLKYKAKENDTPSPFDKEQGRDEQELDIEM